MKNIGVYNEDLIFHVQLDPLHYDMDESHIEASDEVGVLSVFVVHDDQEEVVNELEPMTA